MELRWDPVLSEWIIVSGARGERPVALQGRCPFCPGSEEIPTTPWRVLMLPNRFPALSPEPLPPSIEADGFNRSRPSRGSCEVILYTPSHEGSLSTLEADHIKDVIQLWTERYRELSKKDYVKYVFIFENKGRETGTTLDHPHGQIYAFPFIPPVIKTELKSSKQYWTRHRACLFCRILRAEQRNGSRMVYENDDFACFLPFFARWPYGVHIYPKRHVQELTDLTEKEQEMFALTLKNVLTKFDNLFQMSFPYMMVFHQKPSDGKTHNHYHFHIEFYPPYRGRGKIKYFASVETGAGTITFDYSPEDKAKELRESLGVS
jgi:UDPglucose--hexose-1-phosphate uridylyltransferase